MSQEKKTLRGQTSWGQSAVRWLWRKSYHAPLSERGLAASQEKLVRWASLSKPLEGQSPAKSRKTYRLLDQLFSLDLLPVAQVTDHPVDVEGGVISARSYRTAAALQKSNNKGLVYYHGGGCVIGDLETHDRFCRQIAVMTDMVVISIDYRLAPEYRYPTQILDAIAGWNWALSHACELGVDTARLGVGGDSAGGYLAASVCQQAAASTLPQPVESMPRFQWLVYPWLDCRMVSESSRRCTEAMLLTRHTMAYFIDHMLGGENTAASEQALDHTVSPLLTPVLDSMPPAYIAIAGFDPLESEGKDYARRLRAAGCAVEEDFFPEVMHGFIGLSGTCFHARTRSEQMISQLEMLSTHVDSV
ncbi:MAG: alpha/beta hydrolase [Cellvibrionaceae bacterium]